MDFTETETQAELAALAKKIFTERTTPTRLAEIESGDDKFDPALWADLAGAGILSAALPESLGGADLGLLEQCSVLIEAGRSVAPVPYLASIVLGAGAIARFGTAQQQEKWAAPAGRGELILSAALAEEGVDDPASPVTSAESLPDGGWRLDGMKTMVPAAPLAALFLVPAATPDGVKVFLVEPADAGVTIERQQVTSGDSAGRVTLDGVRLSADRVLGDGAADWLDVTATVGLCAHQAGVTARALELTAEYARTREQFGKPIGAFQAVAQRLADAYIDVEAIKLTMWQAAWRLAEGLPARTEIAAAKFWAADGGHRVAHTTVHVHGGIGIDLEAPAHRYFTTAKQNEFTLGGATAQLLRIGAALAAGNLGAGSNMIDAYIVDAVRTPVGKRGGGLSGVHPADLGAAALTALVRRSGIDPAAVEDVIFGCVDTVGPQAGDIARTAWLAAGLPDHVPGTTVDRQCGSSQQAIHFAAQAVASGTADVIVAGGVQNMSQIPISYAMIAGQALGFDDPFSGSEGWRKRYGDQEVSQFRAAEMIAEKWSLTREQMEEFAVRSHERAISARESGRFVKEIEPTFGLAADEGPRAPNWEKIRSLPPLAEGGRITAAVASQISDAAAALLICSERGLHTHGLTPRARIRHLSVRGADPVWMLTAPIPATAHALRKTGLSIDDIDLVEINEAFASVVLAWLAETGADPSKVNVNGGAIALGHPLGATGARLMTTLLHELERTGGRYGLQTMCEGGGQANVTILERLG